MIKLRQVVVSVKGTDDQRNKYLGLNCFSDRSVSRARHLNHRKRQVSQTEVANK
jgi:hypothetical protein